MQYHSGEGVDSIKVAWMRYGVNLGHAQQEPNAVPV
jgi:hypothetical protein